MLKLCLSRQQRLSNNNEIKRVYKTGKKLSSPFFNVFFYPNQYPYARLCISVAKKQINKANKRNSIRRIIRESFRHQQHQLPKLDVIVTVHKTVSTLDKKNMREMIENLWKRLRTACANYY